MLRKTFFSILLLGSLVFLSSEQFGLRAQLFFPIYTLTSGDVTDSFAICGEPKAIGQVLFDGGAYRGGLLFWVNLENSLILPSRIVPDGVYSDPTKRGRQADAVYPLSSFLSTPTISRKLRTDVNAYKFKVVRDAQPSPSVFQKEVVFLHYPTLANYDINSVITTDIRVDTLEACVSVDGVAEFSLPESKVASSFDAQIRWTIASGKLEDEQLQSTFSPGDARNTKYAITNVPPFELYGISNNENLYTLNMQLGRPLPEGISDGASKFCVQDASKSIILKLYHRPKPPVSIFGDTLWHCSKNPFEVPIQIDDNYNKQFAPFWRLDVIESSPGYTGQPPYINDVRSPGTKIVNITRDFSDDKAFYHYDMRVSFSSDLCSSSETEFVVMVGAPASPAKIYLDTAYACGVNEVRNIEFDNVGISASTVGSVTWNKIEGPANFSIGTQGTNLRGKLTISNLDVSGFGSSTITDYKFEMVTQNRNCRVFPPQRDTVVVKLVPPLMLPTVEGGITASSFTGYIADKTDIIPLTLSSPTLGVNSWVVPPPLSITSASLPNVDRYFISGSPVPALGSPINYRTPPLKAFNILGTCVSDTNRIDLEVRYGYPLYIDSLGSLEQVYDNRVVQLDELSVCTDGQAINVYPHVEVGGIVTIINVTNPDNGLTNFAYSSIKNAEGSDIKLDLTFDPITVSTVQHTIVITYNEEIGGTEILKKTFTIQLATSLATNPVPNNLELVYLCSEASYKLNGNAGAVGKWSQFGGLGGLVIDEPTNPNTLITSLNRPLGQGLSALYEFEWVSDNGICGIVRDTQRIINLSLLTAPYILSIERLRSGVGAMSNIADTVCLTFEPAGSYNYSITSNAIGLGTSQWRYRPDLSNNPVSTPTIASAIDADVLDVSVDYGDVSGNTTYVFERIVYHENTPIGCDTLRALSRITIERSKSAPRLLEGDVVHYCVGDNAIALTAVDVSNLTWEVVSIKDAQKVEMGQIASTVSPRVTEGLTASFYGFNFNPSRNQKDSFSVFVDMTSISSFCRPSPLKNTVELRFLNLPSPAQFVDNEALVLCDVTGGIPTDETIVRRELAASSITPDVGNVLYRKLFDGNSLVDPLIDSQQWEYLVYHGSCDTMRAQKPVLINPGTASLAKVKEDTIHMCYTATSPVTAFTVESIVTGSGLSGLWYLYVPEGKYPTGSGHSLTTLTIDGPELMDNLNASSSGRVIYHAIWRVVSACGATSRDTTVVVHYALPQSSTKVNPTPFYSCVQKPQTTTTIELNHGPAVIGEILWEMETFRPERTIGRLSESNPTIAEYTAPNIPAENTQLSWTASSGTGASLFYANPTYSMTSDETTEVTLKAYDEYLVSYYIRQKMRNGYSCPVLSPIGAQSLQLIVPPPMIDPSYDIPGYSSGGAGLLTICYGNSVPPGGGTSPSTLSFRLPVRSTTAHEFLELNTYATDFSGAVTEIAGLRKTIDCISPGITKENCTDIPYDLSPYTSGLAAYDFSKDFYISMDAVSFWSQGRTDVSPSCRLKKPLRIRAVRNSNNPFQGLGNIQDASYTVCKGGTLKEPIRIENSSANKFVLEKRIYDFNTTSWGGWVRVDSFSNRIENQQFVVKEVNEDSVQFRVEGSIKTLTAASMGCLSIDEKGILQDTVSVRSSSAYAYLPTTVGESAVVRYVGRKLSVCYDVEEQEYLSFFSYEFKPIGTPPNKTTSSVYQWERGVTNVDGDLEWHPIANTATRLFGVNHVRGYEYYRGTIKTDENCLATSPIIEVTYKKGAAAAGCPNPHPIPALSPTGKKLEKRLQVFSGSKNNRVFGFNNGVLFKWDASVPGGPLTTQTGFPLSGEEQDEIFFDANETDVFLQDRIIFFRKLDASNPSDVLRPEDTVIITIEVLPIQRLNPDPGGMNYTQTVLSGQRVYITELTGNLPYQWVSKNLGTLLKTGIASTGSTVGDYTYTAATTDVELTDSILFIKQAGNEALNNALDTVVYYINVQPVGRLAYNSSSREFSITVNSNSNVVLDAFRPGINYSWETENSKLSGGLTGTSVTGIAHTGTGLTETIYTSAVNSTGVPIQERIFFITEPPDPLSYVFGLLDRVIYTVTVNPVSRLHKQSTSLLESTLYVGDSLDIKDYINRGINYKWSSQPFLVTHKAQSNSSGLLPTTRSGNVFGTGVSNFRYFALSSRPLPFSDTIVFVKDAPPAVGMFNNAQDTLTWIISVSQPPRLNSRVGVSSVDTVRVTALGGGTIKLSTPYLTPATPYEWVSGGPDVLGIPPFGSSFGGGDLSYTAVLADPSKAAIDSFLITKTGGNPTSYNYADTVFLIVSVSPGTSLVNTNHFQNVRNASLGLYEAEILTPYSSGQQDIDFSYLINQNVTYSWERVGLDAGGDLITKTSPSTYLNFNGKSTYFGLNEIDKLNATFLANNSGVLFEDTFFLHRVQGAGLPALRDVDKLVLYFSLAPRPTLLRTPNTSSGFVRYEIPYQSRLILIGSELLNASVPFSFLPYELGGPIKTMKASDVISLRSNNTLTDEIRLPIQENISDEIYEDSFLLYNRNRAFNNDLDSLVIYIKQHPRRRLRQKGSPSEVTFTRGPTSNTIDIGSKEINHSVPFTYTLEGTYRGAVSSAISTGGNASSQLVINTLANNSPAVRTDRLLLVRTPDAVPPTPLDSLYVNVRVVTGQPPRLRASGQSREKHRVISSASLLAGGGDISLVIDQEINPVVPYNIHIRNAANTNRVFSEFASGVQPFTAIPSTPGVGSGENRLRFKSVPNRTGQTLYDTITLSRSVSLASNIEQDTLVVYVEISPLPCDPILHPDFLTRIVAPQNEYTLYFNGNSVAPLTYKNLFSSAPRTRKVNPISGASPRTGFPASTSLAYVRSDLTSFNSNLNLGGIDNMVDTIVFYHGDIGNPSRNSSICATDSFVLILKIYPEPCTEGLTGGRESERFIHLPPERDTFITYNPGIDLTYAFETPSKSFPHATDLPRTASPSSANDTIRFRTFQNDYPYVVYDTLDVRKQPATPITTPICPSTGLNVTNEVKTVIAVYPSQRLRSTTSPSMIDLEVYEGDEVRVRAGLDLNPGVSYNWTTQPSATVAVTGLTTNSGDDIDDFVYTAATTTSILKDSLLFTRRFASSNPNFYGIYDSLIVRITVKPRPRLVNSTSLTVDTVPHFFDYSAQRAAVFPPLLNQGIYYDWQKFPHPVLTNAPAISVLNPTNPKVNAFEYDITTNNTATELGELYRLVSTANDDPTTQNNFKDTLYINVRQATKKDYLRNEKQSATDKIYITGENLNAIDITSSINKGVNFDYRFSAGGFLRGPGGVTSGTGRDLISIRPSSPNLLTTDRIDTAILSSIVSSGANKTLDTFKLIVVQRPIVRLRTIGYPLYVEYLASAAFVFIVRDEIYDNVNFVASRQTNNGATSYSPTAVKGKDEVLVTLIPNLTTQVIRDTILVIRDGLYLSQQDSLYIIVRRDPQNNRLIQPSFTGNTLDLVTTYNQPIVIDNRYLRLDVLYNYTVRKHGALDPMKGASIADRTSLKGVVGFQTGTNMTSQPVRDTIIITRTPILGASNNFRDTLYVHVELSPLPRLRPIHIPYQVNKEYTPYGNQVVRFQNEFTPSIPFKKLREFPAVEYRNFIDYTLQENGTNVDRVILDTLYRVGPLQNRRDTIAFQLVIHPVRRLRLNGISPTVTLQLKSRDSVVINASYLNSKVPFSYTYTKSSLLPTPNPRVSTPLEDSIKVYGRVNFSGKTVVDTLQIVRNIGNTFSYNQQDTLVVYLHIPTMGGLERSDARRITKFLKSKDTLRYSAFAVDQPYIYSTLQFDGTDRERVIDSNFSVTSVVPSKNFGQNNYLAVADTSLGVALRDTIRFLTSDNMGRYTPLAGIPSVLDTFDIITVLLPQNLTNGERNATANYQSDRNVTFSTYLNKDVDFDWEFLGTGTPLTGIPATGTGVNALSFTTVNNKSNVAITEQIRLVKKYGSIKTFKDTLVVSISVAPIPRIFTKDTVRYSFHSDRNVRLDSFNANVPFYWDEPITRTGIVPSGVATNSVSFTTIKNLTSTNVMDTILFLKKADGYIKGPWDSLVVLIEVKPLVKLYEEGLYPTQETTVFLCSKEEIVFNDVIAGVSFTYQSGVTGLAPVAQMAVNELRYTVGENTSRTDFLLDTVTLLRSPLVDADDKIREWDSLVLYLHIYPQPPLVVPATLDLKKLCPGLDIGPAQFSIDPQPDNRFDFIWTRDGAVISRGSTFPPQKIGAYDTVRIRAISTSLICPNSNNDTLMKEFTSYDLPKVNIDWTYNKLPTVSLYDTLVVCGITDIVTIRNKVILSQTLPKDITYTWSSSSLPPNFISRYNGNEIFSTPSLVGQQGIPNPKLYYDVKLNMQSQCFDSTIGTVLEVRRSPLLQFELADTICLPNIQYPTNQSIDFDDFDMRWVFSDVLNFADPLSTIDFTSDKPALDFTNYMGGADSKDFYVRLQTSSLCNLNVDITRPIHVFEALKPTMKLSVGYSSNDSLCISNPVLPYISGIVQIPASLAGSTPSFQWELNDKTVAQTKAFEIGLEDVEDKIDKTPNVKDNVRFAVRIDQYGCYAAVEQEVKILSGISHRDEDGLTFLQYNYCPPSRVSFDSRFNNATNWQWFINDVGVNVAKLSENTKLATSTCATCPSDVPADTSYLNNQIFDDALKYNAMVVAGNQYAFCPKDTARAIVEVFSHPVILPASQDAQSNIICLPQDIIFNANIQSSDGTIKEYYWAIDDEDFVLTTTPSYTRFVPNTLATSVVMNSYMVDDRECRSLIVPAYLITTPIPVADFVYKDICLGDKLLTTSSAFKYDAKDNTNYVEWDMGDGTQYKNQDNIEHEYKEEGIYVITLIIGYNNKNCKPDTAKGTITVYAPIDIEIDVPSTICLNTEVPFKVITDNSLDVIQNYSWTFDDPSLASSEASPIRAFSRSGVYEISLTAISQYCNVTSKDTKPITVTESLRPNKTYPTIRALKGRPVQLYADIGARSYLWTHELLLDDPTINNPLATIEQDTRFEVRMDLNGCFVTDIQDVVIVDAMSVVAPSGFTPNGDGINDEFVPIYSGTGKFNYLRVYDASGMEVYSSSNPNSKWDGTYQGSKLSQGVYKWLVSVHDKEGVEVLYSGAVLLTE